MNIRLDPPPVPPLSPAERARLRNRVMDRVQPERHGSRRSWVAPVVGVGAVAAVVAGTLVITNRPPDEPGIAGMPAAAATPTRAASTDAPPVTPPAKGQGGVDLGGVPAAGLDKLLADCAFPNEKTADIELAWSRHVQGITEESTMLVGLARNPKSHDPATSKLGYRYCMTRTPPSGKLGAIGTVGRIQDTDWRANPTAQRPLVSLGGSDSDATNDLRTLQAWHIYRALPDIARVQARYVLNGKRGPWTTGAVADGFAYIQVQASGKFTRGQVLTTEVRAFDSNGQQLPLK